MSEETSTKYELTDLQYSELVGAAMQLREAEAVLQEARGIQDKIMALVIDAHGGDLKSRYQLLANEKILVLMDD